MEKGMAAHSIPQTEKSGGLQSMGLQRVGHTQLSIFQVAHLCLTFCDPVDYIVHGILQARILEWAAIPLSRGSSQPRD